MASAVGRVLYKLPESPKKPRKYFRVESTKETKKGLQYILNTRDAVNADGEGTYFAWADEMHTDGIIVETRRSEEANVATLDHLLKGLKTMKGDDLPKEPEELLRRSLCKHKAKLTAKNSVIRIEDGNLTIDITLPCRQKYSAGVLVESAPVLGSDNSIYIAWSEESLNGLPFQAFYIDDDGTEHPSFLGDRARIYRLKLPLKSGAQPELFVDLPKKGLNFLCMHSMRDGLLIMSEKEDTGNVGELRRFGDASLLWELEGRSLADFDWLDEVTEMDDGYLLIGTEYRTNAEGAKVLRRWTPGKETAQKVAFADDLLATIAKEVSGRLCGFKLIFVGNGQFVCYGNGDDPTDEDKTICHIWRCQIHPFIVLSKATFAERGLGMNALPDGDIMMTFQGSGDASNLRRLSTQLETIETTQICLEGMTSINKTLKIARDGYASFAEF